ncbi:hypothetical protein ACIPV2_01935 [Microbacterium sp. NPDC089987]|uniref:hypothetical protein n=1 Tax=Microbacterium sp. NPDC089987 TaxID=3364202 RepID=UPI00381A6D4A
MLNQAESSRRRELQRRAFAAGGGASEAELAELRELDARAAADAVIAPPPPAEDETSARPVPSHHDAAPEPLPVAPSASAAAPSEAESDSSSPTGEVSRARRRPGIPMLVLSTLIALLLGFGGGWMLLNRDSTPSMTAAQAKAMAEIEKAARFDPGSVVYLGEKYDASVWRATSEDGEKICLAIHVGDRNQHQCVPPPDDEIAFAQPVGVSASHSEDDGEWTYWATLVNDITGREALVIMRQSMADYGWESQYTDEELRQIRMLEAEGVAPNYLQVIGYDGSVPIFISQDARTCIYVVDPATDAVVQSCDPAEDGLYLLQVQDARYEVRETSTRGPILTIVRDGG